MASIGDTGLAAVGIESNGLVPSLSRPSNGAGVPVVAPTRHSRGLVKRALFGLVLWATLVAGSACLLHASIEFDGHSAGRSSSDKAGNGRVGTGS